MSNHRIEIEVSEALPKDLVIADSVVVLKCLDGEGVPKMCIRSSEGIAVWDAVGLLQVGADAARRAAQDDMESFHED